MKRRDFMAASCLAGLAPLAGVSSAAAADDTSKKDLYELRLYKLDSVEKQKALVDFFGKAVIPALNRIGIGPVGVFSLKDGDDPSLYVLLPHKSMQSVVTMTAQLAEDQTFLADADIELIEAPPSDPAYQRIESSLMLAFDGIPQLETPIKADVASRVFQLRIYESHNVEKAIKKIHMFNEGGEIEIFRDTGLSPFFFGATLVGSKMPNLTYMIGFKDMAAGEEAWTKFRADPRWNRIKVDPLYADTVSNITNLFLLPAACSQI